MTFTLFCQGCATLAQFEMTKSEIKALKGAVFILFALLLTQHLINKTKYP
jgi:hypothetical protein